MRIRLPFILFVFIATATAAQELRSPTLNALRLRIEASMPNAEEEFFAGLVTPIVEPVEGDAARRLVTFVVHGNPQVERVTILGGRPAADFEAPLEKLPGTQVWYRTQVLPSDSRFSYFTTINGPKEPPDLVEGLLNAPESIRDPFNPNEVNGASYVVLPDAPPFPFRVNANAPRGTVVDHSIASKVLESDIALRVYLPPGHDESRARPWVMIAFDSGFHDMAPVLDDLIATKKVPPIVVVGVVNRPGRRTQDLGYSEPYARFVVDELLPWARRTFRTSCRRSRSIVAGQSRGGGMASFIALRHPRAFGKVLSVSTAIENEPGTFPPTRFWLRGDDGWIVERFLETPRRDIHFYIAVGRFDTSLWTDRLVNNRRFRDMLRGKGYRVAYAESNGGHDPLFFQRGYAEGLVALTR